MNVTQSQREINFEAVNDPADRQNPLLGPIEQVVTRIRNYKAMAKEYYLEVTLSAHPCPACDGMLIMSGTSECTCCSCRATMDPTVEFQKSPCCQANLKKRTYHYVCTRCNKVVPSNFIFDEKIFDRQYFREMMRSSREQARKRREALKKLLAESRSESLTILDEPCLDAIPGLLQALDGFIQSENVPDPCFAWENDQEFHMDRYRGHILSQLGWSKRLFSSFPLLQDLPRQDKVFRFITLIFMQQENEVELTQHSQNDVWVERVYNEAYEQG